MKINRKTDNYEEDGIDENNNHSSQQSTMAKINLKICMGTMCYVMGGAELKASVDMLPADIKRELSVSYSPCLGTCTKGGEPPYIELDGKVIAGVSKTNLLQIIKEALKNVV